MDAIIERRLPPAPPYPWNRDAERSDSVPSAAAAATERGVGGRIRSLLASAPRDREGSGDDGGARSVLEYLLSKNDPSPAGAFGIAGGGVAAAGVPEGQDKFKVAPSPPPVLFESILRLFPAPTAEVPADTIVRSVMPMVNPADVPAEMDGVQLVLAVLLFLSSPMSYLNPAGGSGGIPAASKIASNTSSTSPGGTAEGGAAPVHSSYGRRGASGAFPSLPLLLCTNDSADSAALAKRRYKRHPSVLGEWSVADAAFRHKLQRLEAAFLTSTPEHPSRYRTCPGGLGGREERTLLLAGMVPIARSSQGVSKGAGGGKGKRKSGADGGGHASEGRQAR